MTQLKKRRQTVKKPVENWKIGWKAILIDPKAETITQIRVSQKDTLTHLRQLIQDPITHVYPPFRTAVICCSDEALLKTDANDRGFWQPSFYPHPICAKAVILGLTSPEGDYTHCTLDIPSLKQVISFPKVRFVGFHDTESIEEHPVIGPINVFRREAIFEPLDERTSSTNH